jgi:plastocyanin
MQVLIGKRLSSDINLAAQILILIGLWIGAYVVRGKQIRRHQVIQTTMVIANSFFILLVMATSFYSYVVAGGTTTGTVADLMIVHGLLGLVAELTGIYLILRMSTQVIPARLRVLNFKRMMRGLLGLWTLIFLLGSSIYYYRYLASQGTAANPLPALAHSIEDIQIHAEEMAQAVQRGNLATAKRHAEHLVNLIEGRRGADYGDVDGNGEVEDPGDGTGALVYLDRIRAEATRPGADLARANSLIGQMQTDMLRIADDAKAVVQAQDIGLATQPMEEASALADQLHDGPTALMNQLAQALGLALTRPTVVVSPATAPEPGAVIVVMENFAFSPKTVKVKRGTTLVFINRDVVKHTVTSDTGKFNSGDIGPGQSYTLKLDEPGTYPYYCSFHGDKGGVDMAGTIVVEP